MEDRPALNPPGTNPGGEAAGGPAAPANTSPPDGPRGARGRGRTVLRLAAVAVVLIAVAAAAVFGSRYWYNATHFVRTDNAQVAGTMIQVGALTAGQVTDVYADVGQRVRQGQAVARVSVPINLGSTASGTPRLAYTNTANQDVDVGSPIDGVVVARLADSGSTVAAGQAIVSVVDPARLYVIPNVDETDIARVKIGAAVDVTLDSLAATLPGRVEAITPATSASFSLIPQQNSSGNFTKVVQVVPVKIAVDFGDLPVVLGSSAEVAVHVE